MASPGKKGQVRCRGTGDSSCSAYVSAPAENCPWKAHMQCRRCMTCSKTRPCDICKDWDAQTWSRYDEMVERLEARSIQEKKRRQERQSQKDQPSKERSRSRSRSSQSSKSSRRRNSPLPHSSSSRSKKKARTSLSFSSPSGKEPQKDTSPSSAPSGKRTQKGGGPAYSLLRQLKGISQKIPIRRIWR